MIDGENYKMTEKTGKVIRDIHFLDKVNVFEVFYAMGTYQISVNHCCGPSAESMYNSLVSGCLEYFHLSCFMSINVFHIPFDFLKSYLLMLSIAKPV